MVLIVVNKFKIFAPLDSIDLNAAVTIGAVQVVTGLLVPVHQEIRLADRASVIFH
jgi:hypothetical protein